MLCPACSSPLDRADAPAAVLFLCARCGGAWLDNAASTQLAAAALSRLALDYAHEASQRAAAAVEGGAYRSGAATTPRERRCPVCRAPLSDAFVQQAIVHLDICAAHGTFFDRDELIAVHTAFENEKLGMKERRATLGAIIHKFRPGKSYS